MEYFPAGGNQTGAEEGEQLRGVRLFGQHRADQRHAVGAEEGAGEVFESAGEVANRGAGIDGGAANWMVLRAAVARAALELQRR